MADEVVRVLGTQETIDNLRSIEEKLRTKIIRTALAKATREVAAKVKGATYGAGRQRRTGRLLRSQSVSIRTRRDEIVAGIIMRKVMGPRSAAGLVRASAQATVNWPAFYWWFLERGTKDRVQSTTGRRTGHVTANPWVGPTFEAQANHTIEIFAQSISDQLDAYCATLPKSKGP